MFEELIFMVGFALFSIIISYVLLKYSPEPLRTLVRGLAIMGIIFHELCHVLMCFLTRTPIKQIKVIEKTDPDQTTFDFQYGGYVELKDPRKITFLQAFLIGFAPLYFSFWLFFFLLDQLLYVQLEDMIYVIYAILMISLTLSAAPSVADLVSIVTSFSFNWGYSLYQIGVLGLSIGTIWLAIPNFQPAMFQEILLYILIGIVYFGYKYSIKLVKAILKLLFGKRQVAGTKEASRARRLFQRRLKPFKPPRSEREEIHW
jgi:hypothetical protein